MAIFNSGNWSNTSNLVMASLLVKSIHIWIIFLNRNKKAKLKRMRLTAYSHLACMNIWVRPSRANRSVVCDPSSRPPLCGKCAQPHSCRIRFHNGYDIANFTWLYAEASAYAAHCARRWGHIGIRAKVNVQHGSICSLNKDRLIGLPQRLIQHVGDIFDARSYLFAYLLLNLRDKK